MNNTVFPVIASTLSPEELAVWIAEKYGFSSVSCSLLKTHMNHSYRVTADKQRYILRVYNHKYRNIEQVTEEVTLLDELKNKVGVSYPIANAAGNFVELIHAPEGNRCVVLFSLAKGGKIRYLSAGLSSMIGLEMGKLHLATQGKAIKRFHYSVGEMVTWAYQQLTKYISPELDEMRFIKNSETILSNAFNRIPLTTGIVHLDIWYDNMSITDDGIVTLFDFDNCGNGALVLDIGYYCMQLYYIESDKADYEKKKAAFEDAYRSVLEIPAKELELIPYAGLAIWLYYLGVHAQRFDYFGNIFLSENYFRMMIARVKDWLKYNGTAIPEDVA